MSPANRPGIMFVCKHNSRRSQMAEGYAKVLGQDQFRVCSAGLGSTYIDPLTIQVMGEVDIDISAQISQCLDDFQPQEFYGVISLCGCGVSLPKAWRDRPLFEDWELDDPSDRPLEDYRLIREQIHHKVKALLQTIAQSRFS